MRRHLVAAIVCFVVPLVLFWPATGHDFIAMDAPFHVEGNAKVLDGLTAEGIGWALSATHGSGTRASPGMHRLAFERSALPRNVQGHPNGRRPERTAPGPSRFHTSDDAEEPGDRIRPSVRRES